MPKNATVAWGKAALGLAGILLLLAGGFFAASKANAGSDWGCGADRIATETTDLAAGGGSKTQHEAEVAVVELLVYYGAGNDSYLAAADSSTGPNRLDDATGQLWVDGTLRAQMGIAQLQDGTYAVDNFAFCSPRLPDLESPGETPSAVPTTGIPS